MLDRRPSDSNPKPAISESRSLPPTSPPLVPSATPATHTDRRRRKTPAMSDGKVKAAWCLLKHPNMAARASEPPHARARSCGAAGLVARADLESGS